MDAHPVRRTIFLCVLVRRCAMLRSPGGDGSGSMMVVVIIVGLACMAAITVMLIKTIWTGGRSEFDPRTYAEALARLEKHHSGR